MGEEFDAGTDYYDVLGVDPDSTVQHIKRRGRELLMKNHPDKGGTGEGIDVIKQAIRVLSSPELRAAYEKERSTPLGAEDAAATSLRRETERARRNGKERMDAMAESTRKLAEELKLEQEKMRKLAEEEQEAEARRKEDEKKAEEKRRQAEERRQDEMRDMERQGFFGLGSMCPPFAFQPQFHPFHPFPSQANRAWAFPDPYVRHGAWDPSFHAGQAWGPQRPRCGQPLRDPACACGHRCAAPPARNPGARVPGASSAHPSKPAGFDCFSCGRRFPAKQALEAHLTSEGHRIPRRRWR